MKSDTETIIKALRILARDIQSDDGVANAAIAEAAGRLEEQQERIFILISERDRAKDQADRKFYLRDEFKALLGTEDVQAGVNSVKAMKERIKRLESDYMEAIGARDSEIAGLYERIKRLEEAGDRLAMFTNPASDRVGAWKQAKEAKP